MQISCETKKTILFIVIAFIFSFGVRLIWVYQFNDLSEFKFNEQFMINTNDGYFWAEGARDLLLLDSNRELINERSPINSALSILTAFLVKYLPFSFETIIFYIPAFFASLIVIPIIFIGKTLGKIELGFIAALISSIASSYYNRTMVGYYDTDFLNIIFPTLLLWSTLLALKTNQEKYLLFTAFEVLVYRIWYPQSYSLEFAFIIMIGIYLVYEIIVHKQNQLNKIKFYQNTKIFYTIELLSLMFLAMIQLELTLKVMLIIAYFMLFRQERWHKHLYTMFIMVLLLFVASDGLKPIIGQLQNYVFKETIISTNSEIKLHYYTVMQTIKEASLISVNEIANRISGNIITFIASIIGYILSCIRYPLMLLGVPMIGLGLLAYSGGLRFTIYAIPVLSLGVAYLIVELSQKFKNKLLQKFILVILTILILIPNLKHIIEYKIPPVFYKSEVKVLNNIKNIISRDDYVISWWDYGYPIRYYTGAKTLSDGGEHSGSLIFPTSYALLNKQDVASKLLKLDVYYKEKRYSINQEKDKVENKRNFQNIEKMMIDYGYEDVNIFLSNLTLDDEIKIPKQARDIYLYLPKRMLELLPTISMFSNIDLMNGKKIKEHFFYQTKDYKDLNAKIILDDKFAIDKQNGLLEIDGQKITINNFVKTYYDANNKFVKEIQVLDKNSPLNVIFLAEFNTILILDNDFYKSTYVQLFILENFDKNLYEPIFLTPLAKVYKLK